MNRRPLIITLAALLVISFAAAAYAGRGAGPGMGGGPGFGCPGWGGPGFNDQAITPELKAKFDVMWTDHQNKMLPLRKDVYSKSYELESLMVEPEANASKIKSLAKDLGALKGKMFEERVNFRAELLKAGLGDYFPGPMGPGGPHRGMRGFGPGGCPGGGFGPGMMMGGPGFDGDEGPQG